MVVPMRMDARVAGMSSPMISKTSWKCHAWGGACLGADPERGVSEKILTSSFFFDLPNASSSSLTAVFYPPL